MPVAQIIAQLEAAVVAGDIAAVEAAALALDAAVGQDVTVALLLAYVQLQEERPCAPCGYRTSRAGS